MLKEKGHTITIYSTRSNKLLKEYYKKHNILVDFFNENSKYKIKSSKPIAFVYIDDRAVCYKGQKAEELVKELENFEVYYKKI